MQKQSPHTFPACKLWETMHELASSANWQKMDYLQELNFLIFKYHLVAEVM